MSSPPVPPETFVLPWMHFQYAAIGFVATVFTHDPLLVIGYTMLLVAIGVAPAHFVTFSPTFVFVWTARMTVVLVTGVAAGGFLVHSMALPRLINANILAPGTGARKADRTSYITLHGLFVMLVMVAGVLATLGVSYWTGGLDSPTFWLGITNEKEVSPVMGPLLTFLGLALGVAALVLMVVYEHTGIGATTCKYIVALGLLLAPTVLGIFGREAVEFAVTGALAAGITAMLWILFPWWSGGVAFRARPHPVIDGLLTRSGNRSAWFALLVGFPHVLLLLVAYIVCRFMPNDLLHENELYRLAFYGSVIICGVVIVFAIIVAALNGRWALTQHAAR